MYTAPCQVYLLGPLFLGVLSLKWGSQVCELGRDKKELGWGFVQVWKV